MSREVETHVLGDATYFTNDFQTSVDFLVADVRKYMTSVDSFKMPLILVDVLNGSAQ